METAGAIRCRTNMRAWAWLLVIAMAAGAVRADELNTSNDQPVRETAHRVELRIVEGMALFRVRRTLINEGAIAEQAHLAILLPLNGVAIGMRVNSRGAWTDARLVAADDAEAQYLEGAADAPRRTPALLAWRDARSLSLRVFPLEPRAPITVEYTVLAPTRYADGRYWTSYPRADTSEDSVVAVPELRVQARGRIEVEGVARRSGEPVALDNDEHRDFSFIVGNRDNGVGYAASMLELVAPASARATRAIAVELELDHPAPEDLELGVVGPGEKAYRLRSAEDLAPLEKRYELEVPGDQLTGTWRLVASDHQAGDVGAIRRWSIKSRDGVDAFEGRAVDTPVAIPDGFATHEATYAQNAIAIVAPVAAPWVARYSHAPTGDGAAIARLDLDVARKMSPLPRRAQVVFVVDASRSLGDDELARETATIRHYLAHVPDAEAEVVVMRRHATRLFGRFLAAGPALAALDRPGALELGNGSALDEALALAAQAIAERPGPRRIVIMTDELLASRLAAPTVIATLARLAPADIVHLVALRDTAGSLRPVLGRREASALAPLAHAHHGLHATLDGDLGGKRGAAVVLELVRPTRLENLRVVGIATEVTELREGEGLRAIERVAAPPKAIEITGKRWSDPVALRIAPDARWTAQTAALIFGDPGYEALSANAQATLAQRGRAVSPVTSYLVTGAGVRPADDHLSGTTCSCDASEMSAYGSLTGTPPPPLRNLIDPAACVQRVHPAAGWRVELAIETTHGEIVDVTSTKSDAMAACLIEAAWALRLPGSYGERAQHRVAFGN